jgi:hypothetical protein
MKTKLAIEPAGYLLAHRAVACQCTCLSNIEDAADRDPKSPEKRKQIKDLPASHPCFAEVRTQLARSVSKK